MDTEEISTNCACGEELGHRGRCKGNKPLRKAKIDELEADDVTITVAIKEADLDGFWNALSLAEKAAVFFDLA